jgi:3-hydroxy-3-methylglutaryl CoA synthase
MIGIKSYGVHLPFLRLNRQTIATYWGGSTAEPGERAVANWDEDTVSMAVGAGMNCLRTFISPGESISELLFASTSFPYKEKQSASIVATALDLPHHCFTADYGNSLRAATIALRAAWQAVESNRSGNILITASDFRLGYPGGSLEQILGDGAGALLIGESAVIASIEGYYGVFENFLDTWRTERDMFVQSWEDRFIHSEGYLRVTSEVIHGLLQKYGAQLKDFSRIIYNAPDSRRHSELARMIKAPKERVADPLLNFVGNTGVASVFISLGTVLDTASPGDKLLLVNYADGADAFILTVTEEIHPFQKRNGKIVEAQLRHRKELASYNKYLTYRELMQLQPSSRPPSSYPTPPALWRENKGRLSMVGAKCRSCGMVHYPARRVCIKCKTKDDFEEVNLSGCQGKVFTLSIDHLTANVDRPSVYVVVDLDQGGRVQNWLTDCDEPEKVTIGMPVEMTFRREQLAGGIYHYGWKPRPIA